MNIFIQLALSAVASLVYAMFFNVRGKVLISSFLGGLISFGVFTVARLRTGDEVIATLFAALAAAAFAEVMARVHKAPATEVLVPSLVPLIPGGRLYYAVLAAVTGDWAGAGEMGAQAIALAGAIAAGLAVAAALGGMVISIAKERTKT